jgi:hypothetical protein
LLPLSQPLHLAWASSRASPCGPRSLIDAADIPVDEHFSLAFGVGNDMPPPSSQPGGFRSMIRHARRIREWLVPLDIAHHRGGRGYWWIHLFRIELLTFEASGSRFTAGRFLFRLIASPWIPSRPARGPAALRKASSGPRARRYFIPDKDASPRSCRAPARRR